MLKTVRPRQIEQGALHPGGLVDELATDEPARQALCHDPLVQVRNLPFFFEIRGNGSAGGVRVDRRHSLRKPRLGQDRRNARSLLGTAVQKLRRLASPASRRRYGSLRRR